MSQGETSDKINEINTQIRGESMDTNNLNSFLRSFVHRNRNAAFFIILKHLV